MESPETHFPANYQRAEEAALVAWACRSRGASPVVAAVEFRTVLTCLPPPLVSQPTALSSPIDRPALSLPSPSPSHHVLYNRSLSVFDCLRLCHSWNKLCFLSIFFLFLMLSLSVCLSFSSPHLCPTFSFCQPPHPTAAASTTPPYPPPTPTLPSAECLLVLSRLRWCDCASPCLQRQTLFTLVLNKPRGEPDPRWHTLASSQHTKKGREKNVR